MDKTIEFSQVVDRCCGLDVHKKDSAWICKLLRAGLLKGSFIEAFARDAHAWGDA